MHLPNLHFVIYFFLVALVLTSLAGVAVEIFRGLSDEFILSLPIKREARGNLFTLKLRSSRVATMIWKVAIPAIVLAFVGWFMVSAAFLL